MELSAEKVNESLMSAMTVLQKRNSELTKTLDSLVSEKRNDDLLRQQIDQLQKVIISLTNENERKTAHVSTLEAEAAKNDKHLRGAVDLVQCFKTLQGPCNNFLERYNQQSTHTQQNRSSVTSPPLPSGSEPIRNLSGSKRKLSELSEGEGDTTGALVAAEEGPTEIHDDDQSLEGTNCLGLFGGDGLTASQDACESIGADTLSSIHTGSGVGNGKSAEQSDVMVMSVRMGTGLIGCAEERGADGRGGGAIDDDVAADSDSLKQSSRAPKGGILKGLSTIPKLARDKHVIFHGPEPGAGVGQQLAMLPLLYGDSERDTSFCETSFEAETEAVEEEKDEDEDAGGSLVASNTGFVNSQREPVRERKDEQEQEQEEEEEEDMVDENKSPNRRKKELRDGWVDEFISFETPSRNSHTASSARGNVIKPSSNVIGTRGRYGVGGAPRMPTPHHAKDRVSRRQTQTSKSSSPESRPLATKHLQQRKRGRPTKSDQALLLLKDPSSPELDSD